jgi:hypothetical protein
METHLTGGAALQRSHAYVGASGGAPSHAPGVDVSVSPTRAIPEICGLCVILGLGAAKASRAAGTMATMTASAPALAQTRRWRLTAESITP